MPGEEGPPKWVQSVLGCAAYFVGINKAELDNAFDKDERELPPALYIATPSFEIQITQDPTGTRPLTRENREEAERNGSKNERGDGVMLQEEAERFELGIAILRDNDDDQPSFTRGAERGNRRNGNGSARSGAGHGDRDRRMAPKPRKKEEQVPEVKVLLRRPQQGESDTDSPASVLLALPDVTIPPPMGINPMANSRSSNEPSPPVQAKKLPTANDRKSPTSKFVPLTRETHPVRRYAGSSSDSDSPPSRDRKVSGRGGRGGTSGRGGGRKNKDRDSEFKNGNFVLLKRPEPAPPAAAKPASSSKAVGSVPAPTTKQPTILARRPVPRSDPPPPPPPLGKAVQTPIQPPTTAIASVPAPVRTILQRPLAPPVPPTATLTSSPAPTAVPTAPRAFGDRGRGRGRGGSRGSGITSTAPNPISNPSRKDVPSKPLTASAAVFEFDDAMLRPGYGSGMGQGQAPAQPADGPSHPRMHGRGRGFGHGHGHMGPSRGRGGFRPPPPHHHHHHHHHGGTMGHARPPPPASPVAAPAPALVPTQPPPFGPAASINWRPAEPAKKIVLQRPTS